MATEAKNTNYWISSTALSIQLNSMGEPDYIQCSVVSGASVLCYMSDVPGLGYDAGHNYQRWTLAAYPSIFPDSKRKYVYIAIPRQSTTDNNQATVVFPGEKIDIYGKTIPSSGTEGVQIGNEAYYYIFTGGIISAVKTDADNTRKREWEQHFDCGKLATDEAIASGGEGAWWRYNSVSDTITFLKEILKANFNELSANVARVTSLFLGGHKLKGVADSNGTLETSDDTVVTPHYLGQFGVKHFLAKDKDDTAHGTITWEKVQKFFSGLLIGNSNNENGGSWTTDAEGRSHLITDYLEVRMKAIFEELVINKTSTIGGKEIISPTGGVVAHKVEEVTVTYNNVSQKAYRCYFLAEQDGDEVDNDFAVNDQVRSESFNVRKGTYHKAGNHFYWRLVIGRDEDPVELEGKKYHYIDLSDTDCATASDVPAKGDVLNQCGNRTDVERQNCLIFSAVDTYSPSISLYHGINSYSFANKEYVEYGVNKQTNKAFFNVYGDMYVGDRPTKENGYEGSSYIRYDSSTKQLSVKGKISAKSTVDGKELSQYIKENTDDTVANAAIKAAEDAQKAAQNAQKDITILGNTVTGNKKEFDNYVTNGYLEPSEIAAMAQDSKRLEDDFAAAQKSYNEVKEAEVLANTNELIDLKTAFDTLTTAKTELVTYLSDISARYNKADTNGKATIVSAVGTKFTNFQSAYASFYDKLGLANAYITRKIYGDLGVVIGDVATYQYLKKVLADGVDTEINGGLILTSLIALRDPETKRVESGINGVIDKTAKGNGIATWWGGYMNDGEVVGFDKKEDYSKQAATSLVRFDGSGYLANGAIWWGTDGRVHADPTSFIISENNLGAYLTFFEPTWKEGSAGTSVADLVSLKPNAPFSKLGVSGDATFEGAISFHGIKLTYDSKNKAIKIDGNLYTTGGITAYGAGASTTGGGGLIASVISYARILEGSYTDADLTSIPNAYAIKALSSRIDNIASELGGLSLSWNNITGKPSTFAPSAHTHKWAEITDRITKVSQLTNDAGYLTAHQSLASYYTKAEIDAKGYTTNKGTVTSVSLTLPAGLTCATKTITTSGTFAISLASGYSIPTTAKQTAWDGAVSAKHTHSNKSVLDGITSTKVTCWDSAYDWYALITTDEETADGVINKWNEVVSFLANIAQTDTLSGIVDGINKSISDEVTRAKKAEGVNASGISTNKTSITTLQGYFTSGSAKKALQLTNTRKLWGNSFNGTADINGSIIVPDGKYISIGNIKMEYDATNKALKITNTTTNEVANLYTSGGVSAYGVGTSSSSGGGLIASVISYARILEGSYTDADLTSIPNAYAIKALSSRIDNIASELGGLSLSWNNITGKPSTFAPSAHTHKWAEITDRITKVSQLTNDAGYLTAHQSLASYYTKAEIDAKGYTTNKGTVTSVSLTLPAGLTCATKTITTSGTFAISLASGYSIPTTAKQTAWDGAVSAKHTHSNKSVLDGITSTKVTCWDSAYDWYALITTDEETADGVINKWNEVVSFLANIAQTDTLSGIVDGINKSISDEVTRAKKAEGVNASGISTNKTSITTLQGYFTSGSAKKALQLTNTRKLWGNSFNGTADINGSIIVPDGKYISIGNIKMEYDATNKALKITNTTTNEVANLYTSGGVSAYGVGTSSSSGGGLNGSVKSYSNALKLTSESLSEIASAYSIKALDSRISSLEGGSATAISVSGSGNAVTSVTKDGTTISVVKGSTFLTSHQSLDGYVNAISVSGSGNAITSVSKSGKSITFTKGATFLTSHQSLANYYTKSSVDTLLSGKSATSHTHSVKINGVTKTIAATGGTAVDLGTYLTSHQSLNGYATQSWVKSQGYLTSHQDVSVLTMANDRYYSSGQWGINMRNSDIIGVNSIYTNNVSETPTEAILFFRSNGNYDGIRAVNGVLYFSNNVVRTTSKYDAEYEVYHKGNLTKLSQLTNDKNFVTGSVSGQTITINGVSTTWQNTWRGITDSYSGTSTGTSLSQKGANSLYNALHNGYASSAGNSDTVDGIHANGLLTALSNSDKGISITVGGTTKSVSNISVNYASSAGNAETLGGMPKNYGQAPFSTIPCIGGDGVMEIGRYIDYHYDNSGKYDFSTRLHTTGNYGNIVNLPSNDGTLALISDNVASATKLQTPRTIWGQSFDGTGNVNGTIYINNRNSSNGAIRLNNDISANARISAIDDQVIFNTGNAIRFGETAWDWNKWAGLKYTHSNKTIYLGIADNSVFNANSAQSNGTLKFPCITTITPDGGARIGGSGGDLYLGNANNSGFVKVQDMCSQVDSNNWKIMQGGYALFKDITIINTATINGSTHINNLLTAKGIMPTTTDVNAFGTNVNNWDGSIGANVTNMFNGIPQDNIQVEYSMDNGATWNTYFGNQENRFNLINDNARVFNYYLGSNNLLGDTEADKLAQIKKNQLRVTVKIPDEIYQELSWISVDVNNGVDIKCQVYFGSSTGGYKEYVSKIMKGWAHKCDICVGPNNVNVGNDSYRYVRLVFSHLNTHTALRNGIVAKIRALALTKYSYNGDRYTISTTGHIYDYDAYMNTYFPNSILAKGGVTAYQSSDIRLKQDLRKLDYLGIIKAMGGTFSFAWKKDNTRSIGWIAQHVLCNPHLKDIVETDENGYYKINYWSPKLIATAFGAIEQVGDEVSRLKARVVFLESEVLRLSGDKEDCNKKRLDNKNINLLN